MKRFFLGLVFGIALPFLAGYLFLTLGGMPVATKGEPLPLEKFVVKTALRAAIKGDLDRVAPFEATVEHLDQGARLYRNNCGGCHGIGDHDNLMARAMFPPAPQFFRELHEGKKGIAHDPIGKIYWKIRNGIRLTGMPGYVDILNDQELWEVSLFLKNVNQLPESSKKLMIGE